MRISKKKVQRIFRGVKKLVPQVDEVECGVRSDTANSLMWDEEDDLDYTVPLTAPLDVRETQKGEVVLDLYVYTQNDGLNCNLDVHLEKGSESIRVFDPFRKKEVFV